MLYIQGMSTCAVQEIVGISYHKTPQDAMVHICQQTLGKGDCAPNRGYGIPDLPGNKGMYCSGLGENYVFHGVEAYTYKGANNSDDQVGYASRLAAFITENKLGKVVAGKKVANHRYHTEHHTRVFLWNPDREAVKAWWTKNGPKPKASIVLPEAPIGVQADIPF